ncbi:hypothetical protein H5410_024500, partial [Solanum commersonii]
LIFNYVSGTQFICAVPKVPHSLGPAFQLFPVALVRSFYGLDIYSTYMTHPYMLDHFHVRPGVWLWTYI